MSSYVSTVFLQGVYTCTHVPSSHDHFILFRARGTLMSASILKDTPVTGPVTTNAWYATTRIKQFVQLKWTVIIRLFQLQSRDSHNSPSIGFLKSTGLHYTLQGLTLFKIPYIMVYTCCCVTHFTGLVTLHLLVVHWTQESEI